MMKAIPQHKRDLIINKRLKGLQFDECIKYSGAGYSTAVNIFSRFKKTGSRKSPGKCESTPPTGIAAKADDIIAFHDANPDANSKDIALHMEGLEFKRAHCTFARFLNNRGYTWDGKKWIKPVAKSVSGNKPERRKTKLSDCDSNIVHFRKEGWGLKRIADYVYENFGVPCDENNIWYRLSIQPGFIGSKPIEQTQTPSPVDSNSGKDASGEDHAADGEPVESPGVAVDTATDAEPCKVVKTKVEKRPIDCHAWSILKWYGEDDTIAEIKAKLMEHHGFPTSDATISRLLADFGIITRRGRKPKNVKVVKVKVEKGEVSKVKAEPREEPASTSPAGRNWKDPKISVIKPAAGKFVQSFEENATRFDLTDPRKGANIKHAFGVVIMLALLCVGARKPKIHHMAIHCRENENLLAQVFDLPNGSPSEGVFRNVLMNTVPWDLSRTMMQTSVRLTVDEGEILLLSGDGKSLNAADDDGKQKGVLTVFAPNQKQTLAAVPCGKGAAEIEVLRYLAGEVKLDFRLQAVQVIADALHGDRKTQLQLTDSNDEYIFQIKGNRKRVLNRIRRVIENSECFEYFSTREINRGRREKRSFRAVEPTPDFMNFWEHDYYKNSHKAAKLGMIVEETTVRNGKKSVRYFIVSNKIAIAIFSKMTRKHWDVENKVHHCVDTSLGEDFLKAYSGNIAVNIAILIRAWYNLAERFKPEMRNSEKLNITASNMLKNLALIVNDHITEQWF